MSKSFSCLIPVYNERKRIIPVLRTICEVPGISQIVCIDDGSTDYTADIVHKAYPQVTLIRSTPNKGKTYAVQKGIEATMNEYVLLMDADLQNLNGFEIKEAITAVSQNDIDMLILRRVNASWFVKMNRSDVLFSGERILKRSDLAAVLSNKVTGYQLEVAINSYMQQNEKKVYWMPSSATNTYKTKKIGLLKGIAKDSWMFATIISYAGWINFVKLLCTFCRKRLGS